MKALKSIWLFVLFFLFMSTLFPQTKNIMEVDGTDWIMGSDAFKVGYIIGFMSGLGAAEKSLSFYGEFIKDEDSKKEFEKSKKKINLYNITVGQINDGIDVFYNEFSNRRIKIIDTVYIVKMQIEGRDSELIEAQIRYLKMQPINNESVIESHLRWRDFFAKKNRYPTYKEIKNGDYSFEDLIKTGRFIDINNKMHDLFCYGNYK